MELRALLLLTILVLTLACDEQPRAEPGRPAPKPVELGASEQAAVDEIIAGSNAFTSQMYGQLKGEPGNLFFSPYSITTAVAMAEEGAKGQTASEIEKLFGLPADSAQQQSGFASLHKLLNPQGAGYRLSIANSFWAQRGFDFLPEYTAVLREHYSAEANNVDFAGATEATRQQINTWVDDKTEQRIPELFEPGMLSPDTRLALVNAIYFKGKWAEQFNPDATQEREFRAPNGKVMAPTMWHKADFAYAEDDNVQVLALPYADSELEMLVVLPKEDAIAAAEDALLSGKLDELPLRQQEITVMLPKFQFDAGYLLNEQLAKLGMPSAFDPQAADFSGMDGRRDLYIGVVIHKAWVQVDEEGTEAAAATGIAMETTAAPVDQPLVFNADHPFLFVIRDRESGLVLFVGRVEDPTA